MELIFNNEFYNLIPPHEYETLEGIKSYKHHDQLIINQIIEAETRVSLVDTKLFTREAATKFKKGSREFINKLIEEQK
mgnify:CR=1 FL=1